MNSLKCFNPGSQNFTALSGMTWLTNVSDTTSLAVPGWLQIVIENCLKVRRNRLSWKRVTKKQLQFDVKPLVTQNVYRDFQLEYCCISPGPTIWWASCWSVSTCHFLVQIELKFWSHIHHDHTPKFLFRMWTLDRGKGGSVAQHIFFYFSPNWAENWQTHSWWAKRGTLKWGPRWVASLP